MTTKIRSGVRSRPAVQRAHSHMQVIARIKDRRIARCEARVIVQALRQELRRVAEANAGIAPAIVGKNIKQLGHDRPQQRVDDMRAFEHVIRLITDHGCSIYLIEMVEQTRLVPRSRAIRQR